MKLILRILFLNILLINIINAQGFRVEIQTGHTKPISDLSFDPNNDWIFYTASSDGTVKVWNIRNGELMKTLYGNNADEIQLFFDPGGYFLNAIDHQGRWLTWNENNLKKRDDFNYEREVDLINKIVPMKYLVFSSGGSQFYIYKTSTFTTTSLPTINEELDNVLLCGNYLCGMSDFYKFVIYNIQNSKSKTEFYPDTLHNEIFSSGCFDEGSEKYFITTKSGDLIQFDRQKKEIKRERITQKDSLLITNFRNGFITLDSPDSVYVVNVSTSSFMDRFAKRDILNYSIINDSLYWIQLKNNNLLIKSFFDKKFNTKNYSSTPIRKLIKKGNLLAASFVNSDYYEIINYTDMITLHRISSPVWTTDKIDFINNDSILISGTKKTRIINLKTGRTSDQADDYKKEEPDTSTLYFEQEQTSKGISFEILREIKTTKKTGNVTTTNFTHKLIKSFFIKNLFNPVKSIAFSPDSTSLATLTFDYRININKLNKDKKGEYVKTFTVVPFINDNWAIYFDNGLYNCSKGALKWLSLKDKDNISQDMEHNDLFYNRPDIVLSKLGNKDSVLINIYYRAFIKRLKRNNLDTTVLGKTISKPLIEIKDALKYPATTTTNVLSLKLKITQTGEPLRSFNIAVNECPIYGINGKPVENGAKKMETTADIPLNEGENRISVKAYDKRGICSNTWEETTVKINYKPAVKIKKKLYLLILSVSQYANKDLNLKYAVKDGRDLANTFSKTNAFDSIIVDTLFDNLVTVENILKFKQKLLTSRPDDALIIFFSGHGMLDKNYDFYCATYDIDYKNPAERGLAYSQIEWLLDSIPLRKKLLMIDACHSGEVDKNEIRTSDSVTFASEANSINQYRGAELLDNPTPKIGMQNTFEIMQELFSDLNNNLGAVVISAAAGNSFALESDTWHNGVFTYCVMDALQNMDADNNHDGFVSVSELRSYVCKKVPLLTHNRQKPTTRQDNVGFDWNLW